MDTSRTSDDIAQTLDSSTIVCDGKREIRQFLEHIISIMDRRNADTQKKNDEVRKMIKELFIRKKTFLDKFSCVPDTTYLQSVNNIHTQIINKIESLRIEKDKQMQMLGKKVDCYKAAMEPWLLHRFTVDKYTLMSYDDVKSEIDKLEQEINSNNVEIDRISSESTKYANECAERFAELSDLNEILRECVLRLRKINFNSPLASDFWKSK